MGLRHRRGQQSRDEREIARTKNSQYFRNKAANSSPNFTTPTGPGALGGHEIRGHIARNHSFSNFSIRRLRPFAEIVASPVQNPSEAFRCTCPYRRASQRLRSEKTQISANRRRLFKNAGREIVERFGKSTPADRTRFPISSAPTEPPPCSAQAPSAGPDNPGRPADKRLSRPKACNPTRRTA